MRFSELCLNSRDRSCLTLCDPMDCSPPGASLHGILQARILEWVAISCSRGSSLPRNRTCLSCICCIGRWILYHWASWEVPAGTILITKWYWLLSIEILWCEGDSVRSAILFPNLILAVTL